MSTLLLHVAAKDARQLRPWLGAFFAVVILRAGLVAAGVSALVPSPRAAFALGTIDTVLGLLHLGLMVVIAVQVVHVDPHVGTTAFWPTRPIPRGILLSAKLLTAVVSLVVVPFLLDAVVLILHRASALDVLGAIAEDAFVRLAVVVPVMTLAAVTADLSQLVIAGVGIFLGTMTLEVALAAAKVLPPRSHESIGSALVVAAALTTAFSLGALAHQVFTRRTGRTVGLLVVSGLVVLLASHYWDTPFLQPPTGLQSGWLDPARIEVTLDPMPPDKGPSVLVRDGGCVVRAGYTLSGAPPDILLEPVSVSSVATFTDGSTSRFQVADDRRAANSSRFTRLAGLPQGFLALGGARLAVAERDRENPRPTMPIASLDRAECEAYGHRPARFDTAVTLGGLAYVAYEPVPLTSRQPFAAAGRRISIQSSDCKPGRCTVEIVEAMPVFVLDLRRPSRVSQWIVNRSEPGAELSSPSADFWQLSIFGRLNPALLAQHWAVARLQLSARAPDSAPGLVNERWLRKAAIVVSEIRDIGSFTVRAKVEETGSGK